MGDCKTWIDEVADVENEGNAELLATIAKKDSRWYCRGAAVELSDGRSRLCETGCLEGHRRLR